MSTFIVTCNWPKLIGLVVLSFITVVFSTGCLHAKSRELTVIASVPPHAFIVEQLAGETVKVISLVDQGSDPHTYEPTPKQMLAISQASIYFVGGLEFERGLLSKIRSINPDLAVVFLNPFNESGHDHEDQHSWLSPTIYARQVDTVYEALSKHLPAQQGAVTIRYDHFKERLAKIELQVRKILVPYRGRVFYVFHPAFGYFGEVYGLRQKAVEVGSKRPTARQLQAIIKRSKVDRVTMIFSQPQFDQRSAKVVADAIGGVITILDPLQKDVLVNYRTIAENFVKSFQ